MQPIILSSWSFHEALYRGEMRLWGVPRAAARLGFDAVELQDLFLWPYGNRLLRALRRLGGFGPSPPGREYDPALLGRVETGLQQAGVRCLVWDADTEFGAAATFDRVGYAQQAMFAAARMGASLVRVTVDPSSVDEAVDALRALLPLAIRLRLRLAVENHDVETAALLAVVERVGSERVGICLDFGNVPSQAAFETMAPYAIHAHAKCYTFDDKGKEPDIPYGERLRALRVAGYEGALSIEYEGDGRPGAAITAARDLILRFSQTP
jgi:sugar phosphate isomerase/epimerase